MKKLPVLILIAVFLYNQVGYFIIFKIRQFEVRKEIKGRIKNNVPQEELAVIKLTPEEESNLDWVKEKKEFRHKGNLFDVVRREIKDDTIIYHCINDVQEKELFAELDRHIRDHMNDQPEQNKQSLKQVVKDYFFESSSLFATPTYNTTAYFIEDEILFTCLTSPTSPPPEQV